MLILLLYSIKRCSSRYMHSLLVIPSTIKRFRFGLFFYIFYELLHKICERRRGPHKVCQVNKEKREFAHYLLKVTCSTDFFAFLCIWNQSFYFCDSRHSKIFTKIFKNCFKIDLNLVT